LRYHATFELVLQVFTQQSFFIGLKDFLEIYIIVKLFRLLDCLYNRRQLAQSIATKGLIVMHDIDAMNEQELVSEIKRLEALLEILESPELLTTSTLGTMPVPLFFRNPAAGEDVFTLVQKAIGAGKYEEAAFLCSCLIDNRSIMFH